MTRTFTREDISQIVRGRVNMLNSRIEELENEIAILQVENDNLRSGEQSEKQM